MILSIINLVLSPFCLIIFLIGAFDNERRFFTKVETNVYRLHWLPYAIYCLVYVGLIWGGVAGFSSLFSLDINPIDLFHPTNYWVSGGAWMVTVLTLATYSKGMEGNIMGFIFFPLLLIASIALVLTNITAFWLFFNTITLPPVAIDLGWAVLLHAFSPLYMILLLHAEGREEKRDVSLWTVPLVSLILQGLLWMINWGIVMSLGKGVLSFSQFFGLEQSILYYLPMLLGLLYWLLFLLDFKLGQQPKVVFQGCLLLVIIGLCIELLYYGQLILSYF
jgi:hypothetical protein